MPRSPGVRSAPARPQYTGYLIARLHDAVARRLVAPGGPGVRGAPSGVEGLGKLLERYPDVAVSPLIKSSVAEMLELELRAKKSEFPPLRSLTSYLLLDARGVTDTSALLRDLRDHWAIDFAYREVRLTLPAVTPGNDVLSPNQKYLNPAPSGIDARHAWTAGIDGAKVGFVDVERAWNETHDDLVAWPPTLIYNDNYSDPDERWHGTAVLGVVAARDNTFGVIGIAPWVDSVRMSSMYDDSTKRLDDLADAVTKAIPKMRPGDVLLVEAQIGDSHPVEIHPDKFDAIRLAAGNGIIVVECAGNGEVALDNWVCSSTGGRCLDRNRTLEFTDSGAIMVGSCDSPVSGVGHVRHWSSNYGSRIDCYAWGENVWTTGDESDPLANDLYSGTFSGTSAAGAIIAGAALLVQSRFLNLTGSPLSPSQMRALLSDPATGTPQVRAALDPPGPPAKKIGVMPNLHAVLGRAGIAPDVYLRDAVGDDGSLPSAAAEGRSPDIIVVPAAAATPVWPGNENSTTLSQPVQAGQNHVIYLRIKNRGAGAATAVTATVYWSESATLLTPAKWNLIGTSAAVPVPQGGGLIVTPPIPWPAAAVPGAGHFCFIGILHDPADPAPVTPGPLDWDGFFGFIRASNNVAWRNFDVLAQAAAGSWSTGPFCIWGAPDEARRFSLEFLLTVPERVHVWWEVPVDLLELLPPALRETAEALEARRMWRLPLPAVPRFRIHGIPLTRDACYRCRLQLERLDPALAAGTQLGVRQLYHDQVVGGVTWEMPAAPTG